MPRTFSHPRPPRILLHAPRLLESLESRVLLSTYYVAPTGNDNNAGTSAAPYKTIQYGTQFLKPGDILDIRAGTYAGFVLGWDSPNSGAYSQIAGTAGNPITIQIDPAAMPGSVVINAANNKTGDAIDLEAGDDYITIKGLAISNASGNVTRDGIHVSGSTNDSVINNTVDKITRFGIYSSFTTNYLVQGNTVTNGVSGDGSGSEGHGIYVSNSAVNPIIRGNIIHNNATQGIHFNGDISQGGTGMITGALVEDNMIYNNGANGINGDGLANSTIQNNLIYGNAKNGITLYQIDAAAPSTGNLVVNNTIVQTGSSGSALEILDGSKNNIIYNNVLLGGSDGSFDISSDSLTGMTSDYNVVLNSFNNDDTGDNYTLAAWRTQTGKEAHSFVATSAQLFVNAAANNYTLLSTSPAINAGTNITAHPAPTVDFLGNPRPNGANWDIGAYEVPGGSMTGSSSVVGRYVFYKGSTFDTTDDNAIATDKSALLPGQTATFANYTSYSRGINGIMVDIAAPAGTLAASDFAFSVGNDGQPSGWATAPAPTVLVRPGAGVGGSTRVEFTWANNVIQNTWLQVTVQADSNTGLAAADVFYFGNAIGDSGNSTTNTQVDAVDELGARNLAADLTGLPTSTAIANVYDYNRDGHVNAADEAVAGSHYTLFMNDLNLISAPAAPAAPMALTLVDATPAAATVSADAVAPAVTPLLPAPADLPQLGPSPTFAGHPWSSSADSIGRPHAQFGFSGLNWRLANSLTESPNVSAGLPA